MGCLTALFDFTDLLELYTLFHTSVFHGFKTAASLHIIVHLKYSIKIAIKKKKIKYNRMP
jgi:hypothetical protein